MSDLSHDPGVQGLAKLGRNAIDRVSELERAIAERDETIAALTLRAEQAERAVELAEGEIEELRSQLAELAADRDEIHRALLMTTDERNRGDRDLHRLRTQLRDPVAVHVAMLRGEIAVPPLAELLHVYGATFSDLDAANIELAKARETIHQLRAQLAKSESTVAFEQSNLKHQSQRMAELRAEAAKWERLHDELYAEIASEHQRDEYGETETAAECVRRVLRERDELRAGLERLTRLYEDEHDLCERPMWLQELIARPRKDGE